LNLAKQPGAAGIQPATGMTMVMPGRDGRAQNLAIMGFE